jgi:hypothetical protein
LKYFLKDVAGAKCGGHHDVTCYIKTDEDGVFWVQPRCNECAKVCGPATPVPQK